MGSRQQILEKTFLRPFTLFTNIPIEAKKIQENTSLIGSNRVFNYKEVTVSIINDCEMKDNVLLMHYPTVIKIGSIKARARSASAFEPIKRNCECFE